MPNRALGNFIRLKRLARGYRQEDVCFAETARLNIGHYCEIERGKVVPKLQTLIDIAEVLRFELQSVADRYLRVQTDLTELEALGHLWLEKGYIEHVYKIARRLFALSKKKGARAAKVYVATGLYLTLCARIKEKKQGSVAKITREMLKLMNKADVYKWMDKLYQLSREEMFFDVLIEMYQSAACPKKVATHEKFNMLYQYCSSLYYAGKYSEALLAAKTAYDHRDGANKDGLVYLLLRWGNILIQQREYGAAVKRYQQCLELLSAQDKDFYIGCLSNIARAYWKDKEPEMARVYWDEVINSTAPYDEARVHALTDLCFAEITEEKYDAARRHLYEVEIILNEVRGRKSEEYRFRDEEALHKRNKGMLLIHEGDYEAAINLLLQSALSLDGGKMEEELVTVAIPLAGIEPFCRKYLTDSEQTVIKELKRRLA